ncbi:MAG: heat-inducible transcriptional repressor HrcA [Betaproteobacteria bacterium]|nr:heat-inducible transcriptional repressor HrcA [Betaproteobacteria bacterium]
MLDERSRILFKVLVEHYISEGHPVGSRALSKLSGLDLSPATIRNVMADLEDMGFVSSPHTSAGRVPTQRGYRMFVDTLLTVQPLEREKIETMEDRLHRARPRELLNSASQLLSQLSHFAGIVLTPRYPAPKVRQIEFLNLSEKRILLIIVTTDGDVQNRILLTEHSYSPAELVSAANYLNAHCAGLDLEQIRQRLSEELVRLRTELRALMNATLAASNEALSPSGEAFVLSGENRLLEVVEFSSNMKRLRELFDLFERRTGLMQLLEISNRADGVRIFIGGESGLMPLNECSVITAPYEVNGEVVGSVGVIGPTRMAYEHVIPIVDITARLLSNALSRQDE